MFSDASHANLPDGASSAGGHVIFLVGERNSCILNWCSKKIKRVVRSTTAAESLALSEALDDVIYLREILCELLQLGVMEIHVEPNIDNKNLHGLIHLTKVISEKNYELKLQRSMKCCPEKR